MGATRPPPAPLPVPPPPWPALRRSFAVWSPGTVSSRTPHGGVCSLPHHLLWVVAGGVLGGRLLGLRQGLCRRVFCSLPSGAMSQWIPGVTFRVCLIFWWSADMLLGLRTLECVVLLPWRCRPLSLSPCNNARFVITSLDTAVEGKMCLCKHHGGACLRSTSNRLVPLVFILSLDKSRRAISRTSVSLNQITASACGCRRL